MVLSHVSIGLKKKIRNADCYLVLEKITYYPYLWLIFFFTVLATYFVHCRYLFKNSIILK